MNNKNELIWHHKSKEGYPTAPVSRLVFAGDLNVGSVRENKYGHLAGQWNWYGQWMLATGIERIPNQGIEGSMAEALTTLRATFLLLCEKRPDVAFEMLERETKNRGSADWYLSEFTSAKIGRIGG